MAKIMTKLETDKHVKVVVFDSAVEGFFLNDSEFLGKLEHPDGPTCRPHRLASVAGYPRAPDSRAGCIDRVDSGAGDWKRK
jgi:hypothetical protein